MKLFLAVFVGGGLGSLLRYVLQLAWSGRAGECVFPWSTFGINVLGSFCIGVFGVLASRLCLPDEARPEALTLKTGVALGLLNTIPGEGLGIVHGQAVRDPDSLFRFALGGFRRGRLSPVLTRHSPVGQWQELGTLREDVTLTLGHSASPRALEGGVARGECAEHRLTWPREEAGHPVFVRALSADRAEAALDISPDCPDGRLSRVLVLSD